MSAHRRRLVLTKLAQRDIRGIRMYTRGEWGTEQALAYEATLDMAMRQLLDFPLMGRALDAPGTTLRQRRVDQHVIYYRVTDDAIEVVRILHVRMDTARHLHG